MYCSSKKLLISVCHFLLFPSLGLELTIDGHFTYPRGVAISHDGHILVTDEHRLQKLTYDGFCVKSVGSSESGSGKSQFCFPMVLQFILLQDRYLLLILTTIVSKCLMVT